jgi:hypothetical protein
LTNDTGLGVAREYYCCPSYDEHVVSVCARTRARDACDVMQEFSGLLQWNPSLKYHVRGVNS